MTDLTYQNEVVGIIRPSVRADYVTIGENMCRQDEDEAWSYDRLSPQAMARKSYSKSAVTMTVEHNGIVCAMFGVITMDGEPTLWMLKTDGLKYIGRNFLKNSREWLDKILVDYPSLVAYVDIRNHASLRWLEFIGGIAVDTVFMGMDEMPFRKFIFQRKELVVRNNILTIEKKISELPNAMFGDCCPLEHTFVDGAYVRKITMPKGMLIVSKLHKITHPYFIMRGDVSVLTENGLVRIKAPFAGVTKAGTKRVLFCHEETEWITVHVTDSKDLEEIENQVIAKDYSELNTTEKSFIEVFTEKTK